VNAEQSINVSVFKY